jgi:hypothetical protein
MSSSEIFLPYPPVLPSSEQPPSKLLQNSPCQYCGGASWSLSPYRQRNCPLASIRGSNDTHRQEASFLHNRVTGLSLSLVAMLSPFNNRPFGMALSLPQCSLFTIIHPAIFTSYLPYCRQRISVRPTRIYGPLGFASDILLRYRQHHSQPPRGTVQRIYHLWKDTDTAAFGASSHKCLVRRPAD